MLLLLCGLALFLAVHSVRIAAETWRAEVIDQRGEHAYKAVYSVVSLIGLVLIVMGYSQTRQAPVNLWYPPAGMSHVAALLTLPAFILLVAAYIPGTHIKSAVGHPMILGVKVWAFAHLLANGRLGDVILFGAFLSWAVLDYISSRKRDRRLGIVHTPMPGLSRDAIAVVAGTGAWLVFALWLHVRLIGVSPFGA
ncbi:MAG: NnrU family protein [Granulosicoccus sp.]|nr:NnrU family protein [Granulosicoccus sp.]